MDPKQKKKLVELEYKQFPGTTSNDPSKGMLLFLDEAAPKVERHFPEYTGSVTLHIRNGKLASWESKAGGRYKD